MISGSAIPGWAGPSLTCSVAVFSDGTTVVAGNDYNWVAGDFQEM